MVDGKKTNHRQISLEQLLHVKRSEQPEPEFWAQFEQEFRQKQLSALVQAQPWFARLGRTIGLIARRSAPVAAAAAAIATGYFVVSGPSIVMNSPEDSPVSERYETIAVRPAESPVVASVKDLPELIVLPVAARAIGSTPVRNRSRQERVTSRISWRRTINPNDTLHFRHLRRCSQEFAQWDLRGQRAVHPNLLRPTFLRNGRPVLGSPNDGDIGMAPVRILVCIRSDRNACPLRASAPRPPKVSVFRVA